MLIVSIVERGLVLCAVGCADFRLDCAVDGLTVLVDGESTTDCRLDERRSRVVCLATVCSEL